MTGRRVPFGVLPRLRRMAGLMLCILAAGLQANPADGEWTDLDDLRWKHRVLLLHAVGEPRQDALAALEADAVRIGERDIVWMLVGDGGLVSNHPSARGSELRDRIVAHFFAPPPGETAVILVGKDGGVKSVESGLDLDSVFGTIDRMPMRRAEMRQ